MRRLLAGMLLAVLPAAAFAQAMQGMDHAAMGHHDMPASTAPALPQAEPSHDAHDMADGHDMTMGPMQGGSAPANARSDDWSDGVDASSMHGMAMHDMDDTAAVGSVLIDRLEGFAGQGAHGQSWEIDGWYGNDTDKVWLRSEGERIARRVHDADAEVFWSHAVATFWDTQLGVRVDPGEDADGSGRSPSREWAAFGLQGLAPYWFELEATAYVGAAGRTAARVRAEYELRITQRLILQPELELNAYGKSDARREIGSGLSNVEGGLRLRYEIRRSVAPYVGIAWEHATGNTANLARDAGRRITDRRWVAGVRLWF